MPWGVMRSTMEAEHTEKRNMLRAKPWRAQLGRERIITEKEDATAIQQCYVIGEKIQRNVEHLKSDEQNHCSTAVQ